MESNSLWNSSKFLRMAIGTILILTIIFLLIQIKPFLNVIFEFITAILYPIVIAIVLYYVFRPLRDYLEKKGVSRWATVLLIFILLIFIMAAAVMFLYPLVGPQIAEFTNTPQEKLEEIENKTLDFINIFNISNVSHEEFRATLMEYIQKFAKLLSENIGSTIASIAQVTSYFIIAPFILFYLLKEDYKMRKDLVSTAPKGSRRDFRTIMADLDDTLSTFISGQVLISLIVSCLIFVGYTFIGLHYAILLALLALMFNLIPFMGPFISTIPAVFIGLADSPLMALKVLAVVSIVHLIDLNLVSPRIVGQKLNIHPITVILLLVASYSFFGILGMFLITPFYAATKVVLDDVYGDQLSKWY